MLTVPKLPAPQLAPTEHSRVQFLDLHPPLEDFCTEVLHGLSQTPKVLSPKFLYDQQGAQLFDAICELEEYYLTRTEMAILRSHASEISNLIGEGMLIEFGSGSSQKIRILLDAASQLETYVALDISKQHLYQSCINLANQYPNLQTIAVCTDYTQILDLPELSCLPDRPRMGFFPGSSIGNLEPQEAIQFLKNTALLLRSGGSLLIGVDLKKDSAILEPAYCDAQGISAAFALNVLARINRELKANFNLNAFDYQSFYNQISGRIEMYIISREQQTVQIGNRSITFQDGEKLRTEYSYKYSIPEFQSLAQAAGYTPHRVWTDPQQLFSIHALTIN